MKRINNSQQTMAPGILPGVKPSDLKPQECGKCSHNAQLFVPLFQLGQASPLQTQTGKAMTVQFPVGFACVNCGAVNPMIAYVEKEPVEGEDLGVNVAEDVKAGEALK